MIPLILLEIAATAGTVGGVITAVVRSGPNLERTRVELNERSARRAGEAVPAPAETSEAGDDVPPLGTRIRLADERTGTVEEIEAHRRFTRVYLRLDDGGGRGHIDIPHTSGQPEPVAVPVPQPQPQAVARPVPRLAVVAPPALPAPAAAPVAAAISTTVRLGGFTMPAARGPVGPAGSEAATSAATSAGGRS